MTEAWKMDIVLQAIEDGELQLSGPEFIIAMIDAIEAKISFFFIVSSLEENFTSDEDSEQLLALLDNTSKWLRANQEKLELDFEGLA